MVTGDAIRAAQEAGLDLVEISPTAQPPVCKITDYGKFKYVEKKRAQQAKKKQTVIRLKEVKMRPNTDDHDVQVKLKHIKRFLDEGDKVKVTVVFRGREVAYADRGKVLMEKITKAVKDLARIEFGPRLEGKAMSMVLGRA